MPELSLVYEGKVVHEGLFSFKDIYKFTYDWLASYEYVIIEKKYSEKIKAEGKEVEAEWHCFRKISDYFRYKIKMTIKVKNMNTVETVRNGVKVKRDKGEIEIKFASYLEKDYENKWESNPITKFFRGIYDKYLIKNTIELYENRLGAEIDELIAQTKAFLALEGRR